MITKHQFSYYFLDCPFLANSKGSSDLNVWVWDEEKTIKYLAEKTERLTKEILAKGLTFKVKNEQPIL